MTDDLYRHMCHCGHRYAIHEYPYACRGGVAGMDEVVACGCREYIEWPAIAADRARPQRTEGQG